MAGYTMNFVPAAPVNGLRREIDRLFDDVFAPTARNSWQPPMNVRENKDAFLFQFDVPGISPESLEVEAHEGVLIVRGSREQQALSEGERQLVSETTNGKFVRRFRLPKEADVNSIAAHNALGVLTVRVAKIAPTKPKKVAITTDTSQLSHQTSDQTSEA